jgi:MFS transporter, PAT family, beta-lactamase induction signal transducer AmpG
VLSKSGKVRLFSFFLLYFGQGLPLGLATVAMPAWMAANGAADADVAAVVATAYLPWSFKWLPAALMDRYAYLPMGRRRLWLILSFGLMMTGFIAAAVTAPAVGDVQLLVAITFLLGAGSAIQDVAVDGLAVDILPDREQGPASSFMFGGQATGTALSGAAAGYLLFTYGSAVTFLAYLPVIACLLVYAIVLRERPGERRFPWSKGAASPVNVERHVGAWLPIMGVTLRALLKRDSIVLIASSTAQRTASGIMTPLFPILATTFLAFNEATYSATVSSIDLGVAIAGIAAGSWLTLRLGPKWSTILAYLGMAAVALLIAAGREIWQVTGVFVVAYTASSLLGLLASITTNPLRMQLSDPRVAATQFTIYNSLSNLPVSLGAMLFATLGGAEALGGTMLAAAGLFAAGAVILLFIRVGRAPARSGPVPEIA